MKEGQTETILTTCFRFRNAVRKTLIKMNYTRKSRSNLQTWPMLYLTTFLASLVNFSVKTKNKLIDNVNLKLSSLTSCSVCTDTQVISVTEQSGGRCYYTDPFF